MLNTGWTINESDGNQCLTVSRAKALGRVLPQLETRPRPQARLA
ncbi:MAG TPA: hypothetical protein VF553_00810 [Pyrinomonadaceae bacterium]